MLSFKGFFYICAYCVVCSRCSYDTGSLNQFSLHPLTCFLLLMYHTHVPMQNTKGYREERLPLKATAGTAGVTNRNTIAFIHKYSVTLLGLSKHWDFNTIFREIVQCNQFASYGMLGNRTRQTFASTFLATGPHQGFIHHSILHMVYNSKSLIHIKQETCGDMVTFLTWMIMTSVM